MSKKIYVGNMSYTTTKDQLEDLFAQYGTIQSVNIIMDRQTNQAKGFAFVEMEGNDSAMAAIAALNGKELNGRALRVNEAQDSKPRQQSNRY